MRARDGPVVEPGHAEGAAVADPLAEDLPAVGKIVAVLPDNLGHVAEVLRFGLAKAEGNGALELVHQALLNAVRHDGSNPFLGSVEIPTQLHSRLGRPLP